jgi:hypothetical protein
MPLGYTPGQPHPAAPGLHRELLWDIFASVANHTQKEQDPGKDDDPEP